MLKIHHSRPCRLLGDFQPKHASTKQRHRRDKKGCFGVVPDLDQQKPSNYNNKLHGERERSSSILFLDDGSELSQRQRAELLTDQIQGLWLLITSTVTHEICPSARRDVRNRSSSLLLLCHPPVLLHLSTCQSISPPLHWKRPSLSPHPVLCFLDHTNLCRRVKS